MYKIAQNFTNKIVVLKMGATKYKTDVGPKKPM